MTATPSIMAAGPLTLDEAEAVLSSRPPPPASVQTQTAPTPDHRIEPAAEVEVERCSCEEALALRAELAAVKADRDQWKAWAHTAEDAEYAASQRHGAAEQELERLRGRLEALERDLCTVEQVNPKLAELLRKSLRGEEAAPQCSRCGMSLARFAGPGAKAGWACVRCDQEDDDG